ncbi:Hsp70 family protein [Salipiger sp. IMCC34102]|uniref:Hsp70 family protein n=1 Tax=Salipiger sp. IMCC34102 TaxID=2510647 RepID=UPI00101D8196|nr:Hsp70 family protein [Salipiger sp. IMCC34102]RYH04042.1 Hsp70 family protein [Salipiger sp. IMCC34102]
MPTLGIDFGTSNTAAAVMAGDRVFRIPVEGDRTTLPTTVFFDMVDHRMRTGSAANAALISGREGRFMRALKSVLGTPLMRETRQIGYVRMTLLGVVADFLRHVKAEGERATGLSFDTALSGRPVRFHPDPDRHARALADLEEAYHMAGFATVAFLPEPEAAALTADPLPSGALGLVVDIGGGTSDFTLFRQNDGVEILSSHGVRVGGTDFDRMLSLDHVMPLLGRGKEVRDTFGSGTSVAPNAIFNDLATWEKIAFLYAPETRRLTADLARQGVDRAAFARLDEVIEMELGHDIAFAVEAGKIAANDNGEARIDLSTVEKNLGVPLTAAALARTLHDPIEEIRTAARTAIGDRDPDQIAALVFVGGSSLMQRVVEALRQDFPRARLDRGAAFTAVSDGLARAAAKA